VDDELSDTEWEREIYRLGVPEEAASDFLTVEDARAVLPQWSSSPERILLLTRDLDHMNRLVSGGGFVVTAVNLGGVYFSQGRQEILPYLFLSEEDRDRVRRLLAAGVEVFAQDLPSSESFDGRDLVHS
jgi:mannose/fructose/N-acetylgalactosamine-specific phosphotransferase system component IIB